MKKICFLFLFFSLFIFHTSLLFTQNIIITDDENYSAKSSAMLDVKSTDKGILIPRLSSVQRQGLNLPATGLLVYDTNYSSFFYFDGSNWRNLLTDIIGVTEDPNIALFSVVNYNGDTVLAVYPNAVEISFDSSSTKAARGGFAISGRGATKETKYDYLRITPDSTRIYIDEAQSKAARGGFAISGRGATKQANNDLLYVDFDTTTISTVLNAEDNIIVGGELFDADGGFYEPFDSVTDYDDNIYSTIIIGSQIWMAENLRTTHYSDGTTIPKVTGDAAWVNLTDSDKAYCWYYNDSATYANTYGALYTWAAAMNDADNSNANPSGIQGICPDGWHLPSDAEWIELEMYLGMSQAQADSFNVWRGNEEGSKLAGDSSLWADGGLENNVNFGTSGFMAVPSGYRYYEIGNFWSLNQYACFWSSTMLTGSSYETVTRYVHYNYPNILREKVTRKDNGHSVRCVKN